MPVVLYCGAPNFKTLSFYYSGIVWINVVMAQMTKDRKHIQFLLLEGLSIFLSSGFKEVSKMF